MEQNKKFRNFCWSDFENDIDYYIKMYETGKWKYIIVGKEICPETKKEHLQCFGVCNSPRTLKSVIKELKPRHVEICKGNVIQNVDYCSKDNNFTEWGEAPKGQGKRTDVDIVRDIVKEGGGMRAVVEVATSYQSIRIAEKYLEYKEPKRKHKPKVHWYYGETGSGKTRQAVERCEEAVGDDYWMSDKSLKWFQGYDAHTHVIFDDFRGDCCKFSELLRILDRYGFRIENKGGARQFLATDIYITCPKHPMYVYSVDEDVGQLLRRIDEIVEFKNE